MLLFPLPRPRASRRRRRPSHPPPPAALPSACPPHASPSSPRGHSPAATIPSDGAAPNCSPPRRGRAFCSGVDLTAAEVVFKGDVKDVTNDPVAQMELCRKPIVGAIAGFAVTAGFEIALGLACDILVAGRTAKFLDTHAKFGIFPSWGLSQKLSCTIGPNRAREVSLTCMPVTAEMAERWGLVNHAVDDNEVLSKDIEVAEAIARNNRNLWKKSR